MTIHLGFELGTGNPVNIPVRHTAVTGQTQESGKTTTLEAMITRSGLRAVCFVTKRGERSFSTGRAIMPYFRESADWRFVESILEATMRERMKFQRSWIMKVCEPFGDKHGEWGKPKTLQDVATNIDIALTSARGLNESVYRELREYLRIVIPQIKTLPKTIVVDLKPGINVMWLDEYSFEMQALIIRSVLEWITEKESHTVTVIPEAWQLLRQDRSSPVLLACEHLIRQGAANQNYIWLDSQDIAGVHKSILRQVGVWILGVQREIHETERTLDHLPGGLRKPKLDEIMKLGKGQFFVAYNDCIRKTYVWPVWMSADAACAVAYTQAKPPAPPVKHSEDEMFRERAELSEKRAADLESQLAAARSEIKQIKENLLSLKSMPVPVIDYHTQEKSTPGPLSESKAEEEEAEFWFTKVWPRVRGKMLADPVTLRVLSTQSEVEIAVQRKAVQLSDDTLKGKLAILLVEGFFDQGQAGYAAFIELKRRGAAIARPSVFNELNSLAKMGIVTIEKHGSGQTYKRVPTVKVTRKEIATV